MLNWPNNVSWSNFRGALESAFISQEKSSGKTCGQNRFFPESRCFFCASTSNAMVCRDCLADLPFNYEACPACAQPNCFSNICAECLQRPWKHIDRTWSLFKYHYPLNIMIQRSKYQYDINSARFLGQLLGDFLKDFYQQLPDCIIPVPLEHKKLASRGYNQATEIARSVSKALGVKLELKACKKNRVTLAQTGLPMKQRRKNIRNAFSVAKNFSCKHVLVIDDVITSGATANELSRQLALSGVTRIDVSACARTGLNRNLS